jgi:uncharacterized membrane protein
LFPVRFWIILAAALMMVAPWMWRGIPSGHDFEFHLNSWMEVAAQWHNHIVLPRWAAQANYGYGEPRFIFYPPFSWTLGALLGLLLPWKLAPAAYVVCVLALAGCAMFVLAREYLPPTDALFAALFYPLNPYHIVIVYWRSAYAELLAAALLPLVLLFILRLERGGRSATICLALVMAAGWYSNAPAAVMINYSAAILVGVVAWRLRSPRVLLQGSFAILVAAGLAAFYILPAAYEQRWIQISQVLSPGVRPQDNFLFTTISDADHNRFNLLASLIAISEIVTGLASILVLLRRRSLHLAQLVLFAWAAFAIVLMLSPTLLLYRYLPELQFVQLPWRWLLCLNVPLALLLPMAFRRWPARTLICAAMLAVIAIVWVKVQPPWWDKAADITEMQQFQHGPGYEGTEEYVPTAGDAYEVDKNARKVTYDGPGSAQLHVLQWAPEFRFLTAEVTQPGALIMRLFNYPAWKVDVNDREADPSARDVTGQMVIPVGAGKNYVLISFRRSWDRTAGAWISFLTLIGVAFAGFKAWHAS